MSNPGLPFTPVRSRVGCYSFRHPRQSLAKTAHGSCAGKRRPTFAARMSESNGVVDYWELKQDGAPRAKGLQRARHLSAVIENGYGRSKSKGAMQMLRI